MPTNFELKRLKPKLDIVKKPENRVHELTDFNVSRIKYWAYLSKIIRQTFSDLLIRIYNLVTRLYIIQYSCIVHTALHTLGRTCTRSQSRSPEIEFPRARAKLEVSNVFYAFFILEQNNVRYGFFYYFSAVSFNYDLNAQCLNTQQDLASLCPIKMWHSGIGHSGAIWYPNHLNATLHVIKGAVIRKCCQ